MKSDPDIRILRAIAGGSRSLPELKTALRRDVSKQIKALTKEGSVEKIDGVIKLTKRGAGRLRFAS